MADVMSVELWSAFFHTPKLGARIFALPSAHPELGLDMFRPTMLVERRIPRMRRVQRIQRPLFAGLGFCSAASVIPLQAIVQRELNDRIRPLMSGDHVAVFPKAELAAMMALSQDAAPDMAQFQPGDSAQIAFGPLAGNSCVVKRVLHKLVEIDVSVGMAPVYRIRIAPCLLARVER